MPSQTTEAALEDCIERALTGGVSVAVNDAVLQEPTPDYGGKGWKRGKPGDFNAEFAVDEGKRHSNDHGIELGTGRVGQQGCPTLWTTNSRF